MPAAAPRYASAIDAFVHGEHRDIPMSVPVQRIVGRLSDAPGARYPAEPGRYHLYLGWFCPNSHRALLQLHLRGLDHAVSYSFVHPMRDARGWAFRAPTGPDPINCFTLLRQAYSATDGDYGGPISVPVLWDRHGGGIVSNDPDTIDVDLASTFHGQARHELDSYPTRRRDAIDAACRHIESRVARRIVEGVYRPAMARELRAMWGRLDEYFTHRDYLVGDALTLADIRLWVLLVRYDAGVNAHGAIGPQLSAYPQLWGYARRLYARPAFRETTRFDTFAAPHARLPDWDEPLEAADHR